MRCELNVKTREKMVDTEDIFRRLTSGAKFNRQRLNEELSFLRVSFALAIDSVTGQTRAFVTLMNAHLCCFRPSRSMLERSSWDLIGHNLCLPATLFDSLSSMVFTRTTHKLSFLSCHF